jgi:hypothetical protein
MISDMESGSGDPFGRLIASVALSEVKCVAISSRRVGDPSADKGEAPNIQVGQARGNDDPLRVGETGLLFRTKFDVKVTYGGTAVFEHSSEFFTSFEAKDKAAFDESWNDETARAVFFDRQLKKTLWPFLREQVQDGMIRLSLAPVTLPWIL